MDKNKIIEAIMNRWTIKSYDVSKKLNKEEVDFVKKVFQFSPSSVNSQPWKLYLVSNPEVKEKLSKAVNIGGNTNVMMTASHVAVFASKKTLEKEYLAKVFKEEQKARGFTDKEYEGHLNGVWGFIEGLAPTKEEKTSWLKRQVYINLGFVMSSLAIAGIGSSPLEGILNKEIDKILNVDPEFETLVVLAIGTSDKEKDYNHVSKLPKARLDSKNTIIEI